VSGYELFKCPSYGAASTSTLSTTVADQQPIGHDMRRRT